MLHDLESVSLGMSIEVDLAKRFWRGSVLAKIGTGPLSHQNHLLMSSLSQRRELTERKVIANFSRRVRDRENLAISICSQRAIFQR
jgi:hypothetical protein